MPHLALLKTAQLAMKVAKLTRSSRVLAAEMAATTRGVIGMTSGQSVAVLCTVEGDKKVLGVYLFSVASLNVIWLYS